MGRVERDREIARRRGRRVKLRKLRALFLKTDDDDEKKDILAKARLISPFIEFEETAAS